MQNGYSSPPGPVSYGDLHNGKHLWPSCVRPKTQDPLRHSATVSLASAVPLEGGHGTQRTLHNSLSKWSQEQLVNKLSVNILEFPHQVAGLLGV